MKTLIIDNYDSYTYNLYQLVAEVSNVKPLVIKNDECNLEELCKLDFDNVILSPGPGRPDKREDFGLCEDIIKYLNKPILGVCLGHQGIYYINGGEIVLAPRPVHGEISEIFHNDKGIFKGIPQGFKVTRYHSLICKYENLENINIDATTQDGLIMGISHKYKPIYGVQFHPESICSEYGREIIENFLKLSEKYYQDNSLLKVSKFKAKFDSVEIFKCLKAYDEKIQWLDSSLIREGLSRFSIFGLGGSRSHFIKYNISSNQLSVITQDNIKHLKEDIFTYLKKNLKNWSFSSTLPFDFQLGYIGYLGYDL
ncbi:MAG: gamma-glutamyl-gamma-aminobutyrate hydrolase family protein [Lagierella massiliensis]|nr:gamma-glutamyl-gamma-aminobutyrate hydrolase family protein [Lagierella massiliensis]